MIYTDFCLEDECENPSFNTILIVSALKYAVPDFPKDVQT